MKTNLCSDSSTKCIAVLIFFPLYNPKFTRPYKTMACFAWVSTYDLQVAEYTTIITMSVYIIPRNYRYIFGLTKFQLVRYLNFPPYPL